MSVDVHLVWFERDLRLDDHEPLDHELEGLGTRLVLRVGTMPAVLEFAALRFRHAEWSRGSDDAYPSPIVDHAEATRAARDRIIAVRRTPEAKTIADEIVEGYGSLRPAPKRRAAEE